MDFLQKFGIQMRYIIRWIIHQILTSYNWWEIKAAITIQISAAYSSSIDCHIQLWVVKYCLQWHFQQRVAHHLSKNLILKWKSTGFFKTRQKFWDRKNPVFLGKELTLGNEPGLADPSFSIQCFQAALPS